MTAHPHWRIRPLREDDAVESFSCGHDTLDLWLRKHAWASQRRRTAATQVLLNSPNEAAGAVIGYYSLASTSVISADLPRRLGRGQPAILPAFLLARLALDHSLQGQGMGGALLSHAVRSADQASRIVAARLLVVDTIDASAASFYEHYGFPPLTTDDHHQRFAAVIKHLL